jgi:hypothetical protein
MLSEAPLSTKTLYAGTLLRFIMMYRGFKW